MSWIVRTITSPRLLPCHLVGAIFFIPDILPTSRVVGVSTTDQETGVVLLGQNTNVIVAILLGLSLHQAELRVSLPGVPLNPLLDVLLQVLQADVVDNIAGSDEERIPVLS